MAGSMKRVFDVRGLTMDFGGLRALDAVDLHVDAGEIVALIGPNGAGKTTTCGKLANWLRKQGKAPVLIALDLYRPAAIEQLNRFFFQGHDKVTGKADASKVLDVETQALLRLLDQVEGVAAADGYAFGRA